jgi:lipoate-protein ligase A
LSEQDEVPDNQISALAPSQWRLIMGEVADGATNMAVDQTIAEAATVGKALPTMRFYTWHPACVSLGRNQPIADIDVGRCASRGFDIVRRPSGGRAILHTDELTYCVAAPASEPRVSGGVLEVYHRLTAGLVSALHSLGIAAGEAGTEPSGEATPSAACFRVPSAHEIVLSGRKLLASAQCRQAGWVLQHGSLPLRGDVGRIADVLALADDDERDALRSALRSRSTTVADVLGSEQGFEQVAAVLAEGWARVLNVTWQRGELSPWERSRAAELRETKYADRSWTERR